MLIPTDVVIALNTHPGISDRDRRVYLALSSFADKHGKCWPSLKAIAERSGLQWTHISKHTARLQKAGLLKVTRYWKWRSNRYGLLTTHLMVSDNGPGKGAEVATPPPSNGEGITNHPVVSEQAPHYPSNGESHYPSNGESIVTSHRTYHKAKCASRTKAKKAGGELPQSPPPSDNGSPAHLFLRWFADEFMGSLGSSYAVDWGRDTKLVNGMLAAVPMEQLQARAGQFLQDRSDFAVKRGYSIPKFKVCHNDYARPAAPKKPGLRRIKADEQYWE